MKWNETKHNKQKPVWIGSKNDLAQIMLRSKHKGEREREGEGEWKRFYAYFMRLITLFFLPFFALSVVHITVTVCVRCAFNKNGINVRLLMSELRMDNWYIGNEMIENLELIVHNN